MRPAYKNSKRSFLGFTLIELLLVISVIGVLAGVTATVVNPSKQREKAADAVITANLEKISLGIQTYLSMEGQLPTDTDNNGIPDPPALGTYIKTWPGTDYKYAKDGSNYGITATKSTSSHLKYRSDWTSIKECGDTPVPGDPTCLLINSTTCGNGSCQSTYGETCVTCPNDCGTCPQICGDSKCVSPETCTTCPTDCGSCASVCGDHVCNGSETCQSCATDCGTCCGNGVCQNVIGETCVSCPADCGSCAPVCGDNVCNGTETCTSCRNDCGYCPEICGNGFCISPGETCTNCPADCGSCPTPFCGDGQCISPETCSTCPTDCTCGGVCGNKICEAASGENCLNCPGDCPFCPGDVCGDRVCGTTETEKTCPFDCGSEY